MDSRGFLPPHDCKQCGKPLQGADSGFPAELYISTYNSLCYKCTAAPGFVERVSALDGAQHWSYPPAQPAWRRDREHYISYTNCEDCKGKGGIMISRSDPMGGSYRTQCKTCSGYYYSHPERIRCDDLRKKAYATFENLYQQSLLKAGFATRKHSKAVNGKAVSKIIIRKDLTDEELKSITEISEWLIPRYRSISKKISELIQMVD